MTARRNVSGAGSESHEQVLVIAHLRAFHPDVLVASVPNGGKRGKREAARLKAEGVLPGYPDLLIDEPRGGFHGLRVEMKRTKGGRLSADQRRVIALLRARGYAVATCHGAADAIETIECYLATPDPIRLVDERRTDPVRLVVDDAIDPLD